MNKTCTVCHGQSWVSSGPSSRRPCICLIQHLFDQRFGKNLRLADVIDHSPVEDKLDDNVILEGRHKDMLSHLRRAITKNLKLSDHLMSVVCPILLKSDSDLIKIHFDEDGPHLADFIRVPDLLILELGMHPTRHPSLPDMLFTVLRERQRIVRPTWILTRDFSKEYAYSERTGEFVRDYFELITITSARMPVTHTTLDCEDDVVLDDMDDRHLNDRHLNDRHLNDRHLNDTHLNDTHLNAPSKRTWKWFPEYEAKK